MHWHILGAGSIGCLWAAHLARAGHTVTLVLRSPERQQALAGKITLEGPAQQQQIAVHCDLATHSTPISHLLVTTKAFDIATALASVAHRLTSQAQVVLLHNGMGPQQQAITHYPTLNIWAASTTDGAWLRKPGHVVHAGLGETRIGRLNSIENRLPEGLADSALTLIADTNIEQSLWRKLAINCAINPLTALHNCRNGELVTQPHHFAQMQQLCHEIDQFLLQTGRVLFPSGLLPVARQVALDTAENYSSMLQDVRHQRPTEIDFITGYLCQQARSTGLHLAENERLLDKIKKIC